MSDTPEESHIKELEAAIEGLGQQNTELDYQVEARNDRIDELLNQVDLHQDRYSRAIKMIENREKQLQLERGARVRLAQRHTKLSAEIAKLNESVRSLKDVPVGELDAAINALANAIDTALLS